MTHSDQQHGTAACAGRRRVPARRHSVVHPILKFAEASFI